MGRVWTHADQQHWCQVSAVCCEGEHQMPIDIDPEQLAPGMGPVLAVHFNTPSDIRTELQEGQALLFHLNDANTMTVTTYTIRDDGALEPVEKTYATAQAHYHAPRSENLIEGQGHAGEFHFVMQAEDGSNAVLALFIDVGTHANPHIDKLLEANANDTSTGFQPGALIPDLQETDVFYVRDGSLTTPPCTEGISWFVVRSSIAVSPEQHQEMLAALGVEHNVRDTQPDNDRPVQRAWAVKVAEDSSPPALGQ